MRLFHTIIDYGPNALLLQWQQRIDPELSRSVQAYAQAARELAGVCEAVPAYASLLVTFDTREVSAYQLRESLLDIKDEAEKLLADRKPSLHSLPVCYGGEFGPDLEEVANELGLGPAEVQKLHQQTTYFVYHLAYQPGFAIMGLLPPELEVTRLEKPRHRVAAGSVGIAGRQTSIYPHEAPGEWRLIGRCPWPMVRTETAPFTRLQAGDQVRFKAVDHKRWDDLRAKPESWTD